MPLSACIIHTAVMLDDSRGCEASTGWVWGLLSGQGTGVSRAKGKCNGDKEVYFVGTICNSAGHK